VDHEWAVERLKEFCASIDVLRDLTDGGA